MARALVREIRDRARTPLQVFGKTDFGRGTDRSCEPRAGQHRKHLFLEFCSFRWGTVGLHVDGVVFESLCRESRESRARRKSSAARCRRERALRKATIDRGPRSLRFLGDERGACRSTSKRRSGSASAARAPRSVEHARLRDLTAALDRRARDPRTLVRTHGARRRSIAFAVLCLGVPRSRRNVQPARGAQERFECASAATARPRDLGHRGSRRRICDRAFRFDRDGSAVIIAGECELSTQASNSMLRTSQLAVESVFIRRVRSFATNDSYDEAERRRRSSRASPAAPLVNQER